MSKQQMWLHPWLALSFFYSTDEKGFFFLFIDSNLIWIVVDMDCLFF